MSHGFSIHNLTLLGLSSGMTCLMLLICATLANSDLINKFPGILQY